MSRGRTGPTSTNRFNPAQSKGAELGTKPPLYEGLKQEIKNRKLSDPAASSFFKVSTNASSVTDRHLLDIEDFLNKYCPLSPIVTDGADYHSIEAEVGTSLKGYNYTQILNTLKANADVITTLLPMFQEHFRLKNYNQTDYDLFFETFSFVLQNSQEKDQKPQQYLSAIKQCFVTGNDCFRTPYALKSHIKKELGITIDSTDINGIKTELLKKLHIPNITKSGQSITAAGSRQSKATSYPDALSYIGDFVDFLDEAAVKETMDSVSSEQSRNELMMDLCRLGTSMFFSYGKSKDKPDKVKYDEIITNFCGPTGIKKRYDDYEKILTAYSFVSQDKFPDFVTSTPYLHQIFQLYNDYGVLSSNQTRSISTALIKQEFQSLLNENKGVEKMKKLLSEDGHLKSTEPLKHKLFLKEFSGARTNGGVVKPLKVYSPAGSGKTVTAQKLSNKIFVTSVRTDIDKAKGIISYEDFIRKNIQDIAGKIVVFDEYESQGPKIKKAVTDKCNKAKVLQMHLSATPNPYEQLIKSNRLYSKSLTKDQSDFTSYKKVKGSKFVPANLEADLLLTRRSNIYDKLKSAANPDVQQPDIDLKDKGFQYFYSSDEHVTLSEKIKGEYARIPAGNQVIISYVNNDNKKSYKTLTKTQEGHWTESEEALLKDGDTNLRQLANQANVKIVCCYDISKTDHIGMDFGILSKEHYCANRVIDADQSKYAHLSLNDWVQLFGRVRSNTSSKEAATSSDKFPLIFRKNLNPSYLESLKTQEIEFLLETQEIIQKKIKKQFDELSRDSIEQDWQDFAIILQNPVDYLKGLQLSMQTPAKTSKSRYRAAGSEIIMNRYFSQMIRNIDLDPSNIDQLITTFQDPSELSKIPISRIDIRPDTLTTSEEKSLKEGVMKILFYQNQAQFFGKLMTEAGQEVSAAQGNTLDLINQKLKDHLQNKAARTQSGREQLLNPIFLQGFQGKFTLNQIINMSLQHADDIGRQIEQFLTKLAEVEPKPQDLYQQITELNTALSTLDCSGSLSPLNKFKEIIAKLNGKTLADFQTVLGEDLGLIKQSPELLYHNVVSQISMTINQYNNGEKNLEQLTDELKNIKFDGDKFVLYLSEVVEQIDGLEAEQQKARQEAQERVRQEADRARQEPAKAKTELERSKEEHERKIQELEQKSNQLVAESADALQRQNIELVEENSSLRVQNARNSGLVKRTEDLEKKLRSQKSEYTQLTEKLQRQGGELKTLKTSKQQELATLTSEYQDQLQVFQDKVRVAENEKAAAIREVEELNSELKTLRGTATAQNQKQAERIQQLQDQLREAKVAEIQANESSVLATNRLATAKLQFDEQVATLKGEIREISLTSHKLQQANEALVAQKEELTLKAEANAVEIDRLTKELGTKETTLQELGKENADLQTRLISTLSELDNAKVALQKQGTAIQDNASLRSNLEILQKSAKGLEEKIRQSDDQIKTLTGERDTARQALADLNTQMELQARESQEEIKRLQGTIAEKDVLIEDLQLENKQLRTLNQELQDQLEASQSTVTENNGTIKELRAENDELNGRNEALDNELLALRTEMQQIDEGARQAIINAREEAGQSVEAIQIQFEQARATLQAEITEKQEELAENEKTLSENDSRISALETENEALKARVTELEAQLDASEKANQALEKGLEAANERAKQAGMALEDFKTTAMRTQTELTAELDAKTAELKELEIHRKLIELSLGISVENVQGQSSGNDEEKTGKSGIEQAKEAIQLINQALGKDLDPETMQLISKAPGIDKRQSEASGKSTGLESITKGIQDLKLEIAELREANSSLTAASAREQVLAQEKLAEQKRQTDLATTIIAEIYAFQYQDQRTVDDRGAAELSMSSEKTDKEDLSSLSTDASISKASIKDQIVRHLYDKFHIVLPAQGLSRVDLSDVSAITIPGSSLEGGSQSTSRSYSPYSSGDEQEQEEEVTPSLDKFLSEQGLNGTAFAVLIKSAFDSKVAGITKIIEIQEQSQTREAGLTQQLFAQESAAEEAIRRVQAGKDKAIAQFRERSQVQKEGHIREVQGLKQQLDAKSSELSKIHEQLAEQQKQFQQLQKKQTYEATRANKSAKPKQIDEKALKDLQRFENEKKKTQELEAKLTKLTEDYNSLDSRLRDQLANELQRETKSQKAEFEKQRNAYEIRVSDLEAKLETSGSDNKKVKAEIAQLKEEMQGAQVQFQQELQETNQKYKELTEEINVRKAFSKWKDNTAKSKLAESEVREAGLREELQEQRTAAQEAAEASQKENTELKEALQGLRTQLDRSGVVSEQQKHELTAKLAEIEVLQTGNSSLEEANRIQAEEFLLEKDELVSSIAKLDDEKKGIESALEKSNVALARQHEALERAASIALRQGEAIQRLGKKNATLEGKIKLAQQQLTLAEQKAGADQKQNDELSASIVDLKSQLTENQRQFEEARSEKAKKGDEVRTLSNDLEASQRENAELTFKIASTTLEIEVKTQQIRDLGIALGEAKIQRDSALAANQGIREVVQQLTNQVSIQTVLSAKDAQIFQQTLSNINSHLVRTNQELRATSEELISVKAALVQSQAELQQTKVENARLVERVSSLEQQVGEKTRELAASKQTVLDQQREARRLNQSNIDLSLQLSDSKGKLDVKDQEIKQLIDAQAQASDAAELARRSLEELQGKNDELQAIRVQLAEANTKLKAQIQGLKDQKESDLETAAAEQEAAVLQAKLDAEKSLREQGEELRREKDDEVSVLSQNYQKIFKEQGEQLQRAQDALVLSQRESAQQHDAIIQKMNTLIRDQATQNRADTEALKKQIVDMQIAHAAETAQSRQENQLLQQQIIAANLEVAKEATKQVQMQTKAATDQRLADNQVRREELADRKAERDAKEQGERDREAKAEVKTKNDRDLAEIKEFKTSVETVGKKFTEALVQFQDLSTLTPELLIKLTDPKFYDPHSGQANFGEILNSDTLRYIDGYIGSNRGALEYIGVKFPNTDPSDLSPENQREYISVVQKLDRDRGNVNGMDQALTQGNLQTQAKTELYLKGINIDRNPVEFLKILAKNETRLTTIPEDVKVQLQTEITTAIASLPDISREKDNIVKIFDRLEPGGLANFAAENTRLFFKDDRDYLEDFAEEICKSAKASNNVAALKKIMLKIKDPDFLDEFIGKIPPEQKQEIVESDKSGRLLKQLLSRKSMTVDEIRGMTELQDLVEAYQDEDRAANRLTANADRDEVFADKLTAAGFDYTPAIKQSADIPRDDHVPLQERPRAPEPKKEYSSLQIGGATVGCFLAVMGVAFLAVTLGATIPVAAIVIAGVGSVITPPSLMSYQNRQIQGEKIEQIASEFKEHEQQKSREQQQSHITGNGINYRNDHLETEQRRRQQPNQNQSRGLD